jgi:hypothetical protein
MATHTAKPGRNLTAPQRYMLSLLNLDGELRIQAAFKITRNNGAQAGFMTSAKALVYRGLARYSENHSRLICTPAGLDFFKLELEAADEKSGLESSAS